MSRQLTRWIALSALAGALALAAGAATEPAQTRPVSAKGPNVLVILTDDQTAESLRVMANVQQLIANEGVTFDNNIVSYSLCCPSRATYMTGQYAHNHGVMYNLPPLGGYDRLDHRNTLAVWLHRAGYTTVHIGKYLSPYGELPGPREIPPGWSEWYTFLDPWTYQFYRYRLYENGRVHVYGDDPASYQTDVLSERAIDVISRQQGSSKPFFVSVDFVAPHIGWPPEPRDPPEEWTPVPAPRHTGTFSSEPLPMPPSFNEADVSDKPSFIRDLPLLNDAQINNIRLDYQAQLEALLAVDEAVTKIMHTLRSIGALDSTYIIFTSDNGYFYGEHRVANGKQLLYEPSIRVPLVIRGPGLPRGEHRSQLVANIDLAPTIVDATGIQPARLMDGLSLLPIARDPSFDYDRDILLETLAYEAIRTPDWLYAEHHTGEQELYDLRNDSYELESLHADPRYAERRAELRQRLAGLRNCAGETCHPRVRPTTAGSGTAP